MLTIHSTGTLPGEKSFISGRDRLLGLLEAGDVLAICGECSERLHKVIGFAHVLSVGIIGDFVSVLYEHRLTNHR